MTDLRPRPRLDRPRSTKPSHQTIFGTHADFADLYEKFLDAAYDSSADAHPGSGRWLLTRQVGNEIRLRDARDVLDCAAGTGFPALNLAATAPDHGIEVLHFTDGDPEMIRVLRRRATALGVRAPRSDQVKWNSSGSAAVQIVDPLLLQWSELDRIGRGYDYVLCRGNSLAYADTWTGGHQVASHDMIEAYVRQIAIKVKPGGYLHIDAPWEAELTCRKYRSVASGAVSIWEQVETESDHRRWRVVFKLPHKTIKFERYSSRLTIHHLSKALHSIGFDDTEPFAMTGERPNFGVIIARRPTSGPSSSSHLRTKR